jgi:RimJ/RimL family protein N-acetyltransferase
LEQPRLISLIRLGNGASVRVAEKIGMRRSAEILQGEPRYWVYALERQDAPASPSVTSRRKRRKRPD